MAHDSGSTRVGGGATTRTQETTDTAQQQAGEVAGHAKEQAGQVAGHAKEQAGLVAGHAKEQAGAVADTAKEQAGAVADTAKEQAGAVLGEAREHAADLFATLRQQLDEQSDTQRGRLAEFLAQAGGELSQMGRSSEGSGMATSLVRQAGDRATAWGRTLEGHDTSDLLEQVRGFARRKPGTFLLGALAAGVLAGRITRGATANSSRTSDRPIGSGSTGQELEPLATAPTPGVLPGVSPDLATTGRPGAGVGTGVAAHELPTTGLSTTGNRPDVEVYGENADEDLVPRHIASDVPSISDAPTHGTRP